MQEMGVSGTGSLEAGDSSGNIFSVLGQKLPEFLKYFYQTYPEGLTLYDLPAERPLNFAVCGVWGHAAPSPCRRARKKLEVDVFFGVYCIVLVKYSDYW